MRFDLFGLPTKTRLSLPTINPMGPKYGSMGDQYLHRYHPGLPLYHKPDGNLSYTMEAEILDRHRKVSPSIPRFMEKPLPEPWMEEWVEGVVDYQFPLRMKNRQGWYDDYRGQVEYPHILMEDELPLPRTFPHAKGRGGIFKRPKKKKLFIPNISGLYGRSRFRLKNILSFNLSQPYTPRTVKSWMAHSLTASRIDIIAELNNGYETYLYNKFIKGITSRDEDIDTMLKDIDEIRKVNTGLGDLTIYESVEGVGEEFIWKMAEPELPVVPYSEVAYFELPMDLRRSPSEFSFEELSIPGPSTDYEIWQSQYEAAPPVYTRIHPYYHMPYPIPMKVYDDEVNLKAWSDRIHAYTDFSPPRQNPWLSSLTTDPMNVLSMAPLKDEAIMVIQHPLQMPSKGWRATRLGSFPVDHREHKYEAKAPLNRMELLANTFIKKRLRKARIKYELYIKRLLRAGRRPDNYYPMERPTDFYHPWSVIDVAPTALSSPAFDLWVEHMEDPWIEYPRLRDPLSPDMSRLFSILDDLKDGVPVDIGHEEADIFYRHFRKYKDKDLQALASYFHKWRDRGSSVLDSSSPF